MPENPENPKLTIIDTGIYDRMTLTLSNKLALAHATVSPTLVEEMLDYVLSKVGHICPILEADEDTCTAQYATKDGWKQCQEDPGHQGDHDSGDWCWDESDPNHHYYRY